MVATNFFHGNKSYFTQQIITLYSYVWGVSENKTYLVVSSHFIYFKEFVVSLFINNVLLYLFPETHIII